jgi:hypothetical protein
MSFDRSTGTEAACRRWAFEPDRAEATRAARDAWRARYARRVDPDGSLDEADRERRIDLLIRADMVAMSRKRWGSRR